MKIAANLVCLCLFSAATAAALQAQSPAASKPVVVDIKNAQG
jgi:hypothetical protein